ncbi:MAG: hypothetical protein ACREQ5_11575 [Candidatus Dormibacteria bacterium]
MTQKLQVTDENIREGSVENDHACPFAIAYAIHEARLNAHDTARWTSAVTRAYACLARHAARFVRAVLRVASR